MRPAVTAKQDEAAVSGRYRIQMPVVVEVSGPQVQEPIASDGESARCEEGRLHASGVRHQSSRLRPYIKEEGDQANNDPGHYQRTYGCHRASRSVAEPE